MRFVRVSRRKNKIMKKIFSIILIIQIACICLSAQVNADSDKINIFKEKNQKVIALFKSQNFKEAQKAADEAINLALEIYGENSIEAATSYRNLGEVLRMRKKYDEAVENFDKALAICQQKPEENVDRIIDILESKGTALAFDGKNDEAEQVLTQQLTAVEKKIGKESVEILPYLKAQTDFYLYLKNFDKADEFFIRRRIISAKLNDKVSETKVADETLCYLYQNLGTKEVAERERKISDAVSAALGSENSDSTSSNQTGKTLNVGMLNLYALNLAKPELSQELRSARIGGTVVVRAVVNKDGSVKSAEAFCGPEILRKSGEKAAFRSKFKKTLINGEFVEVQGIIIYTFIF